MPRFQTERNCGKTWLPPQRLWQHASHLFDCALVGKKKKIISSRPRSRNVNRSMTTCILLSFFLPSTQQRTEKKLSLIWRRAHNARLGRIRHWSGENIKFQQFFYVIQLSSIFFFYYFHFPKKMLFIRFIFFCCCCPAPLFIFCIFEAIINDEKVFLSLQIINWTFCPPLDRKWNAFSL